MSLRRVLPDTNVCYPISLLDLVLRLDEVELHEVIPTTAAAVARAPATILTHNGRDFPGPALASYSVSVHPPDDYLVELFGEHPDVIVDVVSEMAADRRRPAMTPEDVLQALSNAGVPNFAAQVGERLRK